jgi:hypothetical protein
MRNRLPRRFFALISATVVLSTSAWAQANPPVIDGTLWMNSSAEVRKAFLLGAGNMISLESTYSKKKGTAPPTAGAMVAGALDDMTLDQVSGRITRWYTANPGRRNMPVMGVLWMDMVQPASAAK